MKKSILAVLLCALSAAALSILIVFGVRSYAQSTKAPVIQSIYTSARPASFPGSRVADSLTAKSVTPSALTAVMTTNVSMIPSTCSDSAASPVSVVYGKSATNSDYSIRVQIYGAGQATSQYNAYASELSSCGINASSGGSGSIRYVTYDNRYLIIEGDALVSLTVNDSSKEQDIAKKVMDGLDSMMTATNCISTMPSDDSPTRSFYYDRGSYTGLMQEQRVSATKKEITLSIPQSMRNAASMSDVYKSPTIRSAPESPLPTGMSGSLPSAPELPAWIARNSTPQTAVSIGYQVKDESGPGCGWAWSGQSMPAFDGDALNAKYQSLVNSSIKDMDRSILSYNTWAASYSSSSLWSTKFMVTWNQYVARVNALTAQWNALDAARNAFKPTWDAYIQSVYTWEMGRDSYQTTQNNWNTTITNCVNDKTAQWKSQQTDKNASPSKDQTNTWTTQCQSENAKPAALNSPYAQEPTVPAAPSGMTMPASWQTRDQMVKQADADYAANQAKTKSNSSTTTGNGDSSPSTPSPTPSPGSSSTSSPSPSPSPSSSSSSGDDTKK